MATVQVRGWRPGFNKVGTSKAIRLLADVDLPRAKEFIDLILTGDVVTIEVLDAANATKLAAQLNELGAIADWKG